MVSDLMRKVKQIEYIIASLPVTTPSSDVDRLSTLNTESAAADAELMEVSREAEALQEELSLVLRQMTGLRNCAP